MVIWFWMPRLDEVLGSSQLVLIICDFHFQFLHQICENRYTHKAVDSLAINMLLHFLNRDRLNCHLWRHWSGNVRSACCRLSHLLIRDTNFAWTRSFGTSDRKLPDHQELQGRAKTSSGGQQPNFCQTTALMDLRQHRRTKTMTNWQRLDPDYTTINTT